MVPLVSPDSPGCYKNLIQGPGGPVRGSLGCRALPIRHAVDKDLDYLDTLYPNKCGNFQAGCVSLSGRGVFWYEDNHAKYT